MIEYGNDEDFEFDDIYGENYDHLEPMEDWEAEMEREHEDMHKGVDIDEIGTLKVPPENDFEDLLADMDDVKDPFDDPDALDVVDNPDMWGNPDIDYRAPEDPFADMDEVEDHSYPWRDPNVDYDSPENPFRDWSTSGDYEPPRDVTIIEDEPISMEDFFRERELRDAGDAADQPVVETGNGTIVLDGNTKYDLGGSVESQEKKKPTFDKSIWAGPQKG